MISDDELSNAVWLVLVLPRTGYKLFRDSLESDGLLEVAGIFLIGLLLEDKGSSAFNNFVFLFDRGLIITGSLFRLYKIIRYKCVNYC